MENRKVKQVLSGGWHQYLWGIQGKGVGGGISWKYYVPMNENGKMRPVESILGIGERGIKENDGGGEFNYDVL
jgi:hypothetical protein